METKIINGQKVYSKQVTQEVHIGTKEDLLYEREFHNGEIQRINKLLEEIEFLNK